MPSQLPDGASMIRATSIEAWHSIQSALPASRAKVLEIIIRHPDLTGREIESRLAGQRVSRKANARISELHQQGLIHESGARPCSVTGHTAVTWHWTGSTDPLPLPKKPKSLDRIAALEQRIAQLERALPTVGGAQ